MLRKNGIFVHTGWATPEESHTVKIYKFICIKLHMHIIYNGFLKALYYTLSDDSSMVYFTTVCAWFAKQTAHNNKKEK